MIPEIEQHRDQIIAICEEYGLERFGETLRRLGNRDPNIATLIPGIRQAIDQRNMIAHEYYELECDRVHWTRNHSIPGLRAVIDASIADHPEEMNL